MSGTQLQTLPSTGHVTSLNLFAPLVPRCHLPEGMVEGTVGSCLCPYPRHQGYTGLWPPVLGLSSKPCPRDGAITLNSPESKTQGTGRLTPHTSPFSSLPPEAFKQSLIPEKKGSSSRSL